MKQAEAQKIIEGHEPRIIAICKQHGVDVHSLYVSGCRDKHEIKRGYQARMTVNLNDDRPGWRTSDDRGGPWGKHTGKRSGLRTSIIEYVKENGLNLSVRISANYSKLDISEVGIASHNKHWQE